MARPPATGGLPVSLPCRGRFADRLPLATCRGIRSPCSRAGGGSWGRYTPVQAAKTVLPVFGGIRCVPWPPLPDANTPLVLFIGVISGRFEAGFPVSVCNPAKFKKSPAAMSGGASVSKAGRWGRGAEGARQDTNPDAVPQFRKSSK